MYNGILISSQNFSVKLKKAFLGARRICMFSVTRYFAWQKEKRSEKERERIFLSTIRQTARTGESRTMVKDMQRSFITRRR